MKTFLALLHTLLFTSFIAFGQSLDDAPKFAETIQKTDLSKHLTILASDEYEGRETGTEGQRMAAKYISDHFKSLGLNAIVNDSYYQSFPLIKTTLAERILEINQTKFNLIEDFYFKKEFPKIDLQSNQIVFVGYGIQDPKRDDLGTIDVAGKVVVVLAGEPVNDQGIYAMTRSKEKSEWSNNANKIKRLRERNPALIIYVDDQFATIAPYYKHYLQSSAINLKDNDKEKTNSAPVLYVNNKVANTLLQPNKKTVERYKKVLNTGLPSKAFLLKSTLRTKINFLKEELSSENVLGFLSGTDLKDEVVVITAHYDHIGVIDGKVYNGADDDGSGTVAVLELAEAFAEASKAGEGPRRSILFMTVSGEEKGLLGSEYYSTHPILPLEKTVTDLNIDMIGRVDTLHTTNPGYVYIIGSDKLSTTLHAINEEMNKKFTNLTLDYTYNSPSDPNQFYYRSDHYNFAKHNIPIIFYFNGTHADYHQATDEVSKINFDLLQKRTQLIFYTAWNIANRTERLKLDAVNTFPTQKP